MTIQHAVLREVVVGASGSGFVIEDSQLHAFNIDGASNWIIRRDVVDFQGISYNGYNGGSIMYNAEELEDPGQHVPNAYVAATRHSTQKRGSSGPGTTGG